MAGFRFSLEKVRSYKASLEEQLKLQLAAARRHQEEEENRLEHYRQLRVSCPAIQGALAAGDLLREVALLEALDNRITSQQEKVARARLVVREKCDQVQVAMQERKVLDRLRDRQLAIYQYNLAREEQKQIDEAAGSRCHRRSGE
ncbi:Flagellar export FliJ [Moorella glycerini]|uniref:Flagellar FliJ protein n=1 Tax=Neomoorella stamsii TaxID=1266720 RepID=A0A9X7J286_9FIRM|nr:MULTISPECIES: flagellar export protein FliJ [Moorella]PRR72289.1 Flagellar FliJ protein [Moorella stamsii]CEP68900.1 Flagellar export FliJ [Moorella glycerini]CEP69590.1 Flagellar export FliJ [Moorella glycerini]